MAGINKCFICGKHMITRKVHHKGIELSAEQCPHCKKTYFSEKQFDEAFAKIQQARLREDYTKKPIRIGNSIGITFPKEIVEAFKLDKKKVKLTPDVGSGTIQLKIEG